MKFVIIFLKLSTTKSPQGPKKIPRKTEYIMARKIHLAKQNSYLFGIRTVKKYF